MRAPSETELSGDWIVLVGVPERAIVGWVEGHTAVITPPLIRLHLHSRAAGNH